MPQRYKINALATLALAMLFYWFFMFSKHDSALASVNPFAEDPYDAVGSFCMIVSVLLAILSLYRVFRRYRPEVPSDSSRLLVARTQLAVPAGILITLGCDIVAMIRHPHSWLGTSVATELILMLAGVTAASLALLFWVRMSLPPKPSIPASSRKAFILTVASCLILANFPEKLIDTTALHFATIVFAFILIAAPQAALTVALLPMGDDLAANTDSGRQGHVWIQWVAVSLLGIGIGAFAFAGEAFGEKSGVPAVRLLVVSTVFLGAGTSFALVSFGFFRRPLGLFLGTWSSRSKSERHLSGA